MLLEAKRSSKLTALLFSFRGIACSQLNLTKLADPNCLRKCANMRCVRKHMVLLQSVTILGVTNLSYTNYTQGPKLK